MIEKHARIEWIDAAKAMAIVLIVLGHALNGYSRVWHWVYGFHVPFFIVLSGLVYHVDTNMNLKRYLRKKAYNILLPYFFWGLISIIVYQVIGARIDGTDALTLKESIIGLIWANGETGIMRWNLPMWYLPMFFIVQLIAFIQKKIIRNMKGEIIAFCGEVLFAFAIYISEFITDLPFGLETAFYLMPFFTAGRIISQVLPIIEKIAKKWRIGMGVVGCVISTLLILLQDNVDYVRDEYRIYPVFLFAALLMGVSLILLFTGMKKATSFIIIIGKNTLPIMILQRFPLIFFERLCPGISNLYNSNRAIGSIAITILTVVLCYLAALILREIAPWSIGVKTNSRNSSSQHKELTY